MPVPARAWLRPVSGHIPAEHMDLPHNHVVPWDGQPVGARSVHTNHQSFYISLLFKLCVAFMSVDLNNKEDLCVCVVKNLLMEGLQGEQEKCWMQSAQSAMPQDDRSRRAFLCCGSTVITPRLYRTGAHRLVLQPRRNSAFISGLFMAISSLCWNLSSSKT